MDYKLFPFGEYSVLVEFQSPRPVSIYAELAKVLPNADVRLGLGSLLVNFREMGDHREVVSAALNALSKKDLLTSAKHHLVSLSYNGQDLELVAQQLDLTMTKVIDLHQEIVWTVALIGFAPGFPYLIPQDPDLAAAKILSKIGRLDLPRRKVPAGSVGIAAGMSCIYPSEMPGGWHLIGTSEIKLFDATNSKAPCLFELGDTVQFESARS